MLNEKLNRRQFLWLSITSGIGLVAAHRTSVASSVIGANERVNVGIIGIGRRGYRHLSEYLKLPNVRIAAVCDVDENKLREISEQMSRAGLPRPFLSTDYRRLSERSDIDVLSVATPKQSRVEIGISACETGKHLMLEKPFSSSIENGQRLVGLATETKRLAQQRESHSFAPPADISALTQSVDLGAIHAVRGWKKVRMPSKYFRRGKGRVDYQSEVPYEDLIDFAFDELDAARCLLELETPASVSTAYFGGDAFQNVPTGIALRFNFAQGEAKKRTLDFELKFDAYRPLTANSNAPVESFKSEKLAEHPEKFESKSVYSTSHGEFFVECSSDFERFDSENNCWENLISCVRADNSAGLQNPIVEANKSCNLIHLAFKSLQTSHKESPGAAAL